MDISKLIVFRALLNEEDVRIKVPEFSGPNICVSDLSVTIVSNDGIVYASFPHGTPVFFSYDETKKQES
jgi:hypothetical protein